ncbi:hypothetical protein FCULG_00001804 [Fusarium culmorum]|uniref:Uncharacterized protein n=1 Tax=Fusarium culmorum TaxID=5516 RepID=A0A2T4GK82_FUSCU|nr:hypothetical protein FCULG_00001804 [Fusarium culmorum]
MLRARNFKERGNSYVCAFCRHKLSPRDSQLRDRHVSNVAASITSARATGLSSCHSSQIPGVRALSTTSALRGLNDGGKPGGFPGGGFPGGFGAGLGSFGAFANKPVTETEKQSVELLPHELEAPKDNAKTMPAGQNTSQNQAQGNGRGLGQNQRAKGNQQFGRFNEKNNNNIKQTQPTQKQQNQESKPPFNPLSSSILAEAFKTDRAPAPVVTPRAWSTNEPPKPATPTWGLLALER